jgi:hypothetical protein
LATLGAGVKGECDDFLAFMKLQDNFFIATTRIPFCKQDFAR